MKKFLPIVAAAAAGLFAISLISSSKAATPSNKPVPEPSPDLSILLARFSSAMQAGAINPDSLNPDDLDLLSSQLRNAGRPNEASAIAQLAAQVRARRGSAPGPQPQPSAPPNPQLAAVLLTQLQAVLLQAQTSPSTLDPNAVDNLATQFQANNMPVQAQQMRDLAAALRGSVPTGGSTPAKLPDNLVTQMNQLLSPANQDPAAIDALVSKIQTDFPGAFLVQVVLLQQRAKELRAGSGVVGAVSSPEDLHALLTRAQAQ